MQKTQLRNLTIGLIVVSVVIVVAALALRGRSPGVVVRADRGSQTDARGGSTREPLGRRPGGEITANRPENGGTPGSSATGPDGQPLGPDGKPLTPASGADGTTATLAGASGAGTPGAAGAVAGASGKDGSGEAWDPSKPSPAAGPGKYRPGDEEAPEDADENAGNVGGRVLRGEEPVEGAIILLAASSGSSRTVYSRPDGNYIFRGVNPGAYTLVLQSPPSSNSSRALQLNEKENRLAEDFIIADTKPVKGRVVEKSSGEPVANARVEVWNGSQLLGGLTATAEGTFTLFPLEAGNYSLKGGKEGYLPGEKGFQVATAGESAEVTLEMERSGRVSGIVTGPGGAPVAGALVGLFSSGTFADPYQALGIQTTDGSGRFNFTAPSSAMTAPFRAGAFKTGYVPAYSSSYPAAGPPEGEQIAVVLGAGGTVSGRVVDAETVPLEGVEITIRQGFGQSGAIFQRFNQPYPRTGSGPDGTFLLKAVEPGPVTLNFAAETFVPLDQDYTVPTGDLPVGDVVLEAEEETKEGRIFGTVVDENGRPMAGHYVLLRETLTAADKGTRTDSRGGFRFDELAEGEYVLVTNGSTLRGGIYITLDQRYPFAKPGDEKLYLVYDMAQSLRLRVMDQNNQPVRNFKVGINVRQEGATGFGGMTETFGQAQVREFQTADGVAVVDNLIAGTANITVSATSTSGSEEKPNVSIPVGGRADLGDVILKTGAPLEGIVTAAEDGSALSGVLVRLEAPAGSPATHPLNAFRPDTMTDAGGNFRFKGVPVTTVDIVLSRTGRVMKRVRSVQVVAENANNQGEIPMEGAATLTGRLTSTSGAAVVDVQIRVGDTVLFSDLEGKFYADTFPPGQVTVQFHDPTGRFRLAPMSFALQAGETKELNLTMQAAGGS